MQSVGRRSRGISLTKGKWINGVSSTRTQTAALVVLASLVHVAQSIEPSDLLVYQLGPASLRPQISASTEYNDNVFYQTRNTQADVIFGLTPGLRVLLGDELPDANHIVLD